MLNRFSVEQIDGMLLSLAKQLYNLYPDNPAGTPDDLANRFTPELTGAEFTELISIGKEYHKITYSMQFRNGRYHISGLTQTCLTEDPGVRFGLSKRR